MNSFETLPNQTQTIELRLATMDDGFFIFDVTKLCMQEHAQLAWGEFDDIEVRAQCFTFAQTGAAHIINLDGQPAGVFTFRKFEQRFVIEQLYLLPTFQRQGVGSQIINDFVKSLPSGSLVELDVFNSNSAQQFYKKLGFSLKRRHAEHLTFVRQL